MKIFQIEIERKFECIDKKVGIMKIEDSLQEVKIMIFLSGRNFRLGSIRKL